MATMKEKEQKMNRADALVNVPNGMVDELMYALETEDDDAIEEYFYDRQGEVTSYLNSVPLTDRVKASFDLMHNQIDALSNVGSDETRRAATRLNADALLHTCLIPLPPYAPWQLVDLMGHATMNATDVVADILLPLMTQKIAELPPGAFDEWPSDAPLSVHLLRIRSLGVLSMYHENSKVVLWPILERYKSMDVPLLAMVAEIEQANCQLDGELMQNGEDPNLLSDAGSELLHRQAEYEKHYLQTTMPGGFDQHKQYIRIASDAVAGYALGNNVETFVHIQPSLQLDATEIKRSEITGEANAYSETNYPLLYDRHILGAIGDRLGIDTLRLSLATQQRLFEFMVESDTQRFSRFEIALEQTADDKRVILAEAFLATEFGDDYGDAVLDIAERATPEQSAHVFETVGKLRERTKEYANMFAQIDPQLAEATEKALNERITDALVALQTVAVDGKLHQDTAPHFHNADYVHDGKFDLKIDSLEEAMEILDGLEATFATMHNVISADDLHVITLYEDDSQFMTYRFMSESKGNMLAYIRPEGAYGYDKQVEYGNRKGVEASISFMVNPLNPHKLLVPKDKDAVSIRFDREGRLVGEDPSGDRRDPTRHDGLISADVSSGLGDARTLPVKIGRMIAAGNRIRARKQGTEDSLHHNTNYFDQQKYGERTGFAHLARSVIRHIELIKKTTGRKKLGQSATGLTLPRAA